MKDKFKKRMVFSLLLLVLAISMSFLLMEEDKMLH